MKLPRLERVLAGVLFVWALLPLAAAAQQSTAPSGGSTGTTSGAPRREVVPVRPPLQQTQPNIQAPQQSVPPLIFLAGNIVREDGSAPPYGAVIELNCTGSVTREAIVNVNGRFNFQFGGDNRFGQVFPDASQSADQYLNEIDPFSASGSTSGYSGSTFQRQRVRRMLGCEIRAQLAGYRSTSIRVTEEPMSGPNELGTIVLYPSSRVQGNMVSVTNLLAPKSAKKAVEQGRKAVQKEKFAEAEELFKSAIRTYPKYAEAWFDLGLIYEHQEHAEEATNAYREAIRSDELFLKPYIRLAQYASAHQDWRAAADLTEKVISLDPVTRIEAYLICSLAHFNLSELDLSEKRAREGQRMDFSKQFPQFYLILANVFAIRQDSAGSARELRSYLKSAPNASNASLVRSRLQKLEEETNRYSPAGNR